jgi:uncharacterized protein (DUF2252 family)
VNESLFPRITTLVDGRHRIVDQPPVLFHVDEPDIADRFREAAVDYRATLSDDRRVLLDRYRLEDFALKVVGIGSVGTRCYIGLLFSEDGHPLILQFKEARASVYEPYAGKSRYPNHGLRVIVGQRLMQSQSDIFLGFSHVDKLGADFYVRQLRDMKVALDFEHMSAEEFIEYAEACGWVLARAHARSGDPGFIAGYIGKSDVFDRAIGTFAHRYADRNEADHAALQAAVKSGRVKAEVESIMIRKAGRA